MKKKIFTFTNFMILFTVIVYILNLFVVSPDTGSMALSIKEVLTDSGIDIPNPIFFQIFGVWGGHLNDLLGFRSDLIFSGEIWRIFTVVLTHVHLPHIVTNMLALFICGNNIEKKYGTLKTIGLFLILIIFQGFITDLIYFKILGNSIVLSCGASGWTTILLGMILCRCLIDKKYFKKEFSKGERIYQIAYFICTTFIIAVNLFTITAHIVGLFIGLIAEFVIYNINHKKLVK